MPNVEANGIRIEYDVFGDNNSPPVLLIIGLGGQMIDWDNEICEALAEKGFFVIRFDNRDTGLTTKFEDAGAPNIMEAFTATLQGVPIKAPYTLDDMADDAVGLLEALGIKKAHICGMSMGGMIAQTITIRYPQRVLSLTSIYSSTGNPDLPQPKPEIMQILITPPPEQREAAIEFTVKVFKTISGKGFAFDEAWVRDLAGKRYDRSFYPVGVARQLVAVLASGNRKPALASVTVPTLIIHGDEDPLVPIEAGKDTADTIPGSRFMIIKGMGHDLPHKGAWPQIVDAVADHIHKTSI